MPSHVTLFNMAHWNCEGPVFLYTSSTALHNPTHRCCSAVLLIQCPLSILIQQIVVQRALEQEKAALRQLVEQFEQDRAQAELELEEQRRQVSDDQQAGKLELRRQISEGQQGGKLEQGRQVSEDKQANKLMHRCQISEEPARSR